jgi:hypothetical protein
LRSIYAYLKNTGNEEYFAGDKHAKSYLNIWAYSVGIKGVTTTRVFIANTLSYELQKKVMMNVGFIQNGNNVKTGHKNNKTMRV